MKGRCVCGAARELEAVLGQRRIGEAQTPVTGARLGPLVPQRLHLQDRAPSPSENGLCPPGRRRGDGNGRGADLFFKRHVTADQIGLPDGGVWANNAIALAVVEAIALLGWPGTCLRVLSLGCVNEVYAIRSSPGWGTLARDMARLFMDRQSRGALGVAKLLTGHEHERDAIFRCCPDVPKDLFRLDDTSKIAELQRMGAAAARKERPRLEPVFL
jgi:hypothetical protein